jgi:hypothetical protein
MLVQSERCVGGYTIGGATFDALVFGYEGDKLMYAARTRNGFASALRADLMKKFKRSKPRNVRSESAGEESRPLGALDSQLPRWRIAAG